MRFDTPLDDLFSNLSFVRVLRSLVELPEGFGASAREIARRAGLTHPTASKVLSALADQGLVGRRRSARGDEYSLKRDHVLAQEVVLLFDHERSLQKELVEFLSGLIARYAPQVDQALLFGSFVKGGMSVDSDLDVAVVCSTRVRLLVEAGMRSVEDEVRNRYGNRVNVLVGDPVTAFARRIGRKSGPPSVWQRIRTEGIPIPLSARAKARHG